jgi:hypothetical protein
MRRRDPGMPKGRLALIDKLRHLASHPTTDDSIRRIAKDKLALLAPDEPSAASSAPDRPTSGREAVPNVGLDTNSADGMRRDATMVERFESEQAPFRRACNLDILV